MSAKVEERRRTSYYKERTRVLWVTIILLSLFIISLAVFIASTRNYDWLFKVLPANGVWSSPCSGLAQLLILQLRPRSGIFLRG